MKILVACEESQAVTIELRKLGHEAYSNDLKECTGNHPDWHIAGDCFDVIRDQKWDMIIAHPPCTHISVTGNRHYAKGKEKHHLRLEAADFIQKLWDLCVSVCDKVAFENPIGQINTFCNMPKASYIQPYWFGDAARKKTGTWLHGLKPLKREVFDVEPEIVEYTRANGKKTTFSKDYMEGVDRSGKMKASTKRSKTYPGIAKAMAEQWAGDIT